jgi:N6-adenosine-specific RNA methylase IME4
MIEQMYPELPKIELFARNARAGWAACCAAVKAHK